ncbi:MAG: polysaccharide pyruvyl transferase family protein [Clostridiaceae bacterium]|nr:polysaccharide pyruvyl transferase family protein [Clostridiaceae bacterium]
MSVSPYFVLAGNAPYENRGCEAIVRGTMQILERSFSNPQVKLLSFFKSAEHEAKQWANEIDGRISHGSMVERDLGRFSKGWLELQVRKRLLRRVPDGDWYYGKHQADYEKAAAVLSIGGDNYSLDYGIPHRFTMLDDYVLSLNRPSIIWGASIGPFSKIPEYERYMASHLKEVTAIFARETATIDYLSSIGVKDNVYLVADPAFVMPASEPPHEKLGLTLQEGAIGINLSPLIARYTSDYASWEKIATDTVRILQKELKRPIYLIPHVIRQDSNDYLFLKKVTKNLSPAEQNRVFLIPPTLNAQELKWVISNMFVFAGARTHSTIAALSSMVPTLSIAYSIKARGINEDLFGNLDYCLKLDDYTPKLVCEKISELLQNNPIIRQKINEQLPKIIDRSYHAGELLKQVVKR